MDLVRRRRPRLLHFLSQDPIGPTGPEWHQRGEPFGFAGQHEFQFTVLCCPQDTLAQFDGVQTLDVHAPTRSRGCRIEPSGFDQMGITIGRIVPLDGAWADQ